MAPPRKPNWLDIPPDANYAAAASYLSLSFPPKRAKSAVKELKRGSVVQYQAKDIFRASSLSLLGVSDKHVERDLKKIRAGKPLSPLLLVRVPELAKVVVGDGYHRLCAVYLINEDAVVPCKIA